MSFLAPLFLLGALAIAGPILFHLVRRSARERTLFSSLMFFRPAAPPLSRRRKIEHVWLLILRCACLALLAAAFARPLFTRHTETPAPPAEMRQRILLVDTSASMRREGAWRTAQQIAERYLGQSSPEDQVAVMAFDRQPRTLVGFAEWESWPPSRRITLAREELESQSPGWMSTQLGLALTGAAEEFTAASPTAAAPTRRELVVISDFQEGAALDGLQGYDWPRGVQVILEKVDPKHRANAGLQVLESSDATGPDAGAVRARIANSRDSSVEKFRVNWIAGGDSGAVGKSLELYVSPGQTRTFTAPALPRGVSAGALRLQGDEEDFDNVSFFAAPEVEHPQVAYFGSDNPNDPEKLRYYLERVFDSTPRSRPRLIPPGNLELPLAGAAFAVIARNLDPHEIEATRDWLAGGKTALLVLTGTDMAPTLGALAGNPNIPVTEAAGNYALLGQIDFKHPVFAPFAEPSYSDFTAIHFWKHRRWIPPADSPGRVLAKFDDGSPALAQLSVGKGSLLVLASGWSPEDSQLALSSKFPPLIETMLDWAGTAGQKRYQFLTGETIPSPDFQGGSVQWEKPDGKKVTLPAGTPFADTSVPGIYTATSAGRARRFAVNLSLNESRTAPLSQDDLARLGVPIHAPSQIHAALAQVRERTLLREELENRQKLWRWLIVGALAVTLVEIILRDTIRPKPAIPGRGSMNTQNDSASVKNT